MQPTTQISQTPFTLPEDGLFPILAPGDFPLTLPDGTTLIQVIDAQSIAAIAAAFQRDAAAPSFPGLLLDRDHFSYDPSQSTEAAGWITAIVLNSSGGLSARIRLTDTGRADLLNGRYRFASPSFRPRDCEPIGPGRIRPMRLDTVALTNKPNMTVLPPLTNRAPNPAGVPPMKDLALALALPETADQPALLAGIVALNNRATEQVAALAAETAAKDAALAQVTALTNRIAAFEQADAARAADATLADFSEVIPPASAPEFRAQLLANRDGTLKLLAALRANRKAEGQPLVNRAALGTPSPLNNRAAQEAAKQEVMKTHGIRSHAAAWNKARELHPELWTAAQ